MIKKMEKVKNVMDKSKMVNEDVINTFEYILVEYEAICCLDDNDTLTCDVLYEFNDYMSNEFEKYNLEGFNEINDDKISDCIIKNYNILYHYLRNLISENLKVVI